jgi:hypothetical protein
MFAPLVALLFSLLTRAAPVSASTGSAYEETCTTDLDCAEKFGEEP